MEPQPEVLNEAIEQIANAYGIYGAPHSGRCKINIGKPCRPCFIAALKDQIQRILEPEAPEPVEMNLEMNQPRITEEWLLSNGFHWEQFERQPAKHWVLWLGGALVDYASEHPTAFRFGAEDLGIELTSDSRGSFWFCWLRSDIARRYGRFIHIRHLVYVFEIVAMIEGLTGRAWEPHNAVYGALMTQADADRQRAERERLDVKLAFEREPWHESEKDPSRTRPNAGHIAAAIDGGKAK